MNPKTLLGIAIAAVLAVAAAIAIDHARSPTREGAATAQPLVPGLRDHLNDLSRVVLASGGATFATLSREADGWHLAEKGGYRADTGKLREFLIKLADANLIEAKTANPQRYADLGVEDAGPSAKGVQIELDGMAEPQHLIVGIIAAQGGGTFVRRAGETQSWLAKGQLVPERNPAEWLARELVDIPSSRVARVSIVRDGHVLRVERSSAGQVNFALLDVPKGREVASEFVANALASVPAGLRFDDVLPAAQAEPPAGAIKATYATFDGIVVDVTAWTQDGRHLARIGATFDRAQAERHVAAEQAAHKIDEAGKEADAAKDDPAKERDERLAALEREATDLAARAAGWTYVLPAYKYANLDKSLDDLLKPVEAKPAKKG